MERVDGYASRLAQSEWADRPRQSRTRWALVLASETLTVFAIAGLILQRSLGAGIWIALGGVYGWLGVFFLLLAKDPRVAFKWLVITGPLIPIVAIAVAFATS